MFDDIDRAYFLKRAADHAERAKRAQDDGRAAAAQRRLAADYQERAAELLRREVARQIG